MYKYITIKYALRYVRSVCL